jgi:hypothetical protein
LKIPMLNFGSAAVPEVNLDSPPLFRIGDKLANFKSGNMVEGTDEVAVVDVDAHRHGGKDKLLSDASARQLTRFEVERVLSARA